MIQKKQAFTLIELLVVISIIALLLAIMLPGLQMVKERAKKVVCGSNMRGIITGVTTYLASNGDAFHTSANNGMWWNYQTGEKLEFNSPWAYWGVAYAEYTGDHEIFNCPSAKEVDCWIAPGETFAGQSISEVKQYFEYCHYGLNPYCSSYSQSTVKSTKFKRPSRAIFCQDHVEQKMDSINSDMLCIGPNVDQNLVQWRVSLKDLYPNAVQETYRHSRRSYESGSGACQTVWLDGHVSDIKQSTGEDVPVEWYTGNKVR